MQPEELPSCNSSLQKGSLLSDEQPQLTEEQLITQMQTVRHIKVRMIMTLWITCLVS